MTLHVQGELRWRDREGDLRPLPSILPVALLLVLAKEGKKLPRSEVAALFWPDATQEVAALNLRVNLHKARRVLAELGAVAELECDRHTLRWNPPLDVPRGGTVHGPIAVGLALPGFDNFESWLRAWRESCAPAALDLVADRAIAADEIEMAAGGVHFYGRRVELARLRASSFVAQVVIGEPGVGKTALIEAAFAPCVWLRCREGLRQAAFCAVTDLFSAHPEWLTDLGAYRLDLARLLPELAPNEPLPPLDALTARTRLFEAMARAVEVGVPRLAVDDLQWADSATIDWLVMLAHRGRVRWIASARSGELLPETQVALRGLERRGLLGELPLGGLDRTALNAVLHDRRPDLAGPPGAPGEHAWLDALWRYTGGNAFYAVEIMDGLKVGDLPHRLGELPLPTRVSGAIQQRLAALDTRALAVVQAAAISIGPPSVEFLAGVGALSTAEVLRASEEGERLGLLNNGALRHDVLREVILANISPARANELHTRAAQALDAAAADPEKIAHHWIAAGQWDAAAPWLLRSVQRLKQRGERDRATALLERVRELSTDQAVVLRVEVMLAQERLFDDLPGGRKTLTTILARADCLPAGSERRAIEAHALAGLIDNAVFSGDLALAASYLASLSARLEHLAPELRIEVHQVIIEAAMRMADFGLAKSSLQALRDARCPLPVILSFEAQIHWFSGDLPTARAVFEALLVHHADYCQGITIENDLAVIYYTLGELGAAEAMARRSLKSWAGVAHTEALSMLVLGAILVSLARFDEATAALEGAEQLAREQGSALFVGEAQVRRAMLYAAQGNASAALRTALAARETWDEASDPLRQSAVDLAIVLGGSAAHHRAARESCARLVQLVEQARHPLALVRCWRGIGVAAESERAKASALDAAKRQAAVASRAGLAEWRCEALWRIARQARGEESEKARAEALALAHSMGFKALLQQFEGETAPPVHLRHR